MIFRFICLQMSKEPQMSFFMQENAALFEKSAGVLKNKMMLGNLKMTIICIVVGLIGLYLLYGKDTTVND